MKTCNRCNQPRTSDNPPLCPKCLEDWQGRTGAAASGLKRSGASGFAIGATFEQDAINHEFKLGAYAPKGKGK